MAKLAVLSLVQGSLDNGFSNVSAALSSAGDSRVMQFYGSLPASPEIVERYRSWRFLYEALYHRVNLKSRLRNHDFEIEEEDILQVSVVEFSQLCERLQYLINSWLNSEEFRPIDQKLRQYLHSDDEIQVIIETNDNTLRRLPWHLWNFFEDYKNAEVALSSLEFQKPNSNSFQKNQGKVKILAIIGNSQGIDTETDKRFLQQLSDRAKIEFLVEPKRKELDNRLWEQGWDILFFAGHSYSEDKGIIKINQTDAISVDKLRNALKKAIAGGLKLAIFNSCDGLGLAKDLEDLNIPQVIVMREGVPDFVAQEFVRYFLTEFSRGESLHSAVRYARERLQALEDDYPCASWLPVIYQNPAVEPMVWLQPPSRILLNWKDLLTTAFICLLVASLVMGIRHLGLLQASELQAFDRIMQWRSLTEKPDPRLLIVTIDEADIQYQIEKGMNMEFSLSNQALEQLLQKLKQYKAQTIGLDIYRNQAVDSEYRDLIATLNQDDRLFAVCKVPAELDGAPEGIPPPPEVPQNRLGFSDFISDDDGVLRRHLLSMTPNSPITCPTSYSLSLQLAAHYLNTQNIELQVNKRGNLQIKDVEFKKLQNHNSGYQAADTSGYQILLNYHSLACPRNIAQQISLRDFLQNQEKLNLKELIKNRIVLIGVTAASSTDEWKTPYSAVIPRPKKVIPGVYIQAHMVSQIISAAIDNRPLIWWLPWWMDGLWIWLWCFIGGILSVYNKKYLLLTITTAISLIILSGICYIFFVQAAWIPLIPASIGLLISALIVKTYKNKN